MSEAGDVFKQIPDPTEGIAKRSGGRSVHFEGKDYTQYEWIFRCASLGHCLGAGEGRLLVNEIERLTEELRAWRKCG